MTEQIPANSDATAKDSTTSENSPIRRSLANKLHFPVVNPSSTPSLAMCTSETTPMTSPINEQQSTSWTSTPSATDSIDATERAPSLTNARLVDSCDSYIESFDDEDEMSYDGLFLSPVPLPQSTYIMKPCPICLEQAVLQASPCCTFHCCSSCWKAHIEATIDDGRIKISCMASECNKHLPRETIVNFIRNDSTLHDRYLKLYDIANQNPRAKTCPRCAHLYSLDGSSSEVGKPSKKIPKQVQCSECSLVWCFRCAAPWHENLTCKQFLKGDKLLLKWVNQKNEEQWNARKCPKCSSVIQRAGGCPHMTCSSCECEFCYLCGRRYVKIPFLGQHNNKFSVFGCPYNLHPEKPWLRRTVRGLIATGAVVVSPIIVVGAVTAAVTVLPPLGVYKLVRHVRSRRRVAQALARAQAYHFEEDDGPGIDYEEFERVYRQMDILFQSPEDVFLSPFAEMDVESLVSDQERLPADFRTCPSSPVIGAREEQGENLDVKM